MQVLVLPVMIASSSSPSIISKLSNELIRHCGTLHDTKTDNLISSNRDNLIAQRKGNKCLIIDLGLPNQGYNQAH
ncbi:hypothetical protein BDV34DRAFT_151111 [Aspergillus parasiticus]|uniref:Uncharacterized protein n=1 Tax=Aspergillus parasiticus TaxID=5067 RepID=A0A5N6E1V9_ASPPA|nr:hypothetical protein BDV34DRAFT_151111 [Aspergillus parasiticus]